MNPTHGSRVECPHSSGRGSAGCAGCPGIGIDLDEQLASKAARIREALQHYPGLGAIGPGPVEAGSPAQGYRVRAKLVVDGSRLGLFSRAGHQVADIPECPVLAPDLLAVAAALRSLLPLKVPLLAVDLRSTVEGVLVTLVVAEGASEQDVSAVAEQLISVVPNIAGVASSVRARSAPVVLGRGLRIECGSDAIREPLDARGAYAYAAHGVFAQAHPGQAARIRSQVEQAVMALGTAPAVMELHSGAGALSLVLAARGARVTAVESFGRSIELLERAAREQGFNIEALADDAGRAARFLRQTHRQFDAVVVNPPRTGLPPQLRREIALLAPQLVVYVSCCPETLARDLSHLRLMGLAGASMSAFDMIPQSGDVEILALIRPDRPPLPQVIYEDDALIAVTKLPHEPTTPQGEHAESLLARVRRLPGAEQAVPVHRLDVGTSGVCLFARRSELVPPLAQALAAGQKEYLALARGITRPKGTVARSLQIAGIQREARTRYRRIAVVAGHSLVLARPDQGRKHQIRRHFAGIGHPILGDERYGDPASNRHLELRHGLDRGFLHCLKIELQREGRPVILESAAAGDLNAVLQSLRSTVLPSDKTKPNE